MLNVKTPLTSTKPTPNSGGPANLITKVRDAMPALFSASHVYRPSSFNGFEFGITSVCFSNLT